MLLEHLLGEMWEYSLESCVGLLVIILERLLRPCLANSPSDNALPVPLLRQVFWEALKAWQAWCFSNIS